MTSTEELKKKFKIASKKFGIMWQNIDYYTIFENKMVIHADGRWIVI